MEDEFSPEYPMGGSIEQYDIEREKQMEDELNYDVDSFDHFVKDNWSELVKLAEESTGELFSGREPLLTKDEIISEAVGLWTEYCEKYEEMNRE